MNPKILNALSYFSVLFLPVLLPLLVFFTTDHHEIKKHAMRAMISQAIPFVIFFTNMLVLFIIFIKPEQMLSQMISFQFSIWHYAPFILSIVYTILFGLSVCWNLLQGVRSLKPEKPSLPR